MVIADAAQTLPLTMIGPYGAGMALNKDQSARRFPGPIAPWSAEDLRAALGWPFPGGGRLGIRLAGGLRELIRSGELPAGTGLPPSRAMAAALGVSRGVVVTAYDQLLAEGFLDARQGAGTWVGRVVEPSPGPPSPVPAPVARPGLPDLGDFPRNRWLAAYRYALSTASSADLGYGDPRGHATLRTELAGHLARTRGVVVDADNILITNGVAEGLALLSDVLLADGCGVVAVEDPASPGTRDLLVQRGVEVVGVPVDDQGMDISRIRGPERLGAIVLTPAHQYPTGVVLSATRRHALIDLARAHGSVLVEDDYDGAFRFDREPVGCLQGLAPDVTVLLGSVSKTLVPALRLGWLVGPPRLQERLVRRRAVTSLAGQTIDQLALARLLRSGMYDKHVRQMRRNYHSRRQELIRELTYRNPDIVIKGDNSGLHLLIELPLLTDELLVLSVLRRAGFAVQGLSECRLAAADGGSSGLVIGFASIKAGALAELAELVSRAC
ncbi:PLP-dependent aminotransferase family protein [Actinokineospora sp. PR83]|uniref:MocR-like pyridoxine biosynthesis transcription factor PdxR n=1 Tax=Actinokineospora sp. PR83 TaxID=2884908 RepID=UPI001F46BE6E|nr:PLP-dependent aminotransferase family protein [Actinokineospora sp. PR83]MCG8917735.1 PLP-dependent aminotransferase family protein [Actinokineospora sp. PR83]